MHLADRERKQTKVDEDISTRNCKFHKQAREMMSPLKISQHGEQRPSHCSPGTATHKCWLLWIHATESPLGQWLQWRWQAVCDSDGGRPVLHIPHNGPSAQEAGGRCLPCSLGPGNPADQLMPQSSHTWGCLLRVDAALQSHCVLNCREGTVQGRGTCPLVALLCF